ncbi:MAG: hypothetical protein QUV05_09640 [Phycisphaerae bacterium]|nr:hypothetical protein [Phycisphaerae bacterium]
MLDVEITRDEIHFGASVTVRFMRTLRVPIDGQEHPLPVDLEPFPIFRVEDYIERVPDSWRVCPGVFISVHPHEAMWISFSARPWKPNAVQIAVGSINALTGKPLGNHLTSDPQDYLVCPPQSALVGFSTAEGLVRQFALMSPATEEPDEARPASWRGLDSLLLTVSEPRPGRFRDRVVRKGRLRSSDCGGRSCPMTFPARGQIREQIQPDPYGTETWDLSNFGQVCVHMVNVATFLEIAGCEPPDCPLN